jgi:hypothetical protein
MIKLFVFVRRRTGIDDDRFWGEWRGILSQMSADGSVIARGRLVENRAIAGARVPELTLSHYDGTYELWLSDPDLVTAALKDWDTAASVCETTVSVPGSTILLAAEESPQFDRGAGAVKFMGLSRRAATFPTREDWIRYWIDVHGPMAHGIPEFTRYYRRYVHNYIVPNREGTGGLEPPWDGIVEESVDSVDAFARCLAEPGYLEIVRPDEVRFVDFDRSHILLVEEHEVSFAPRVQMDRGSPSGA